MVFSRVREEYRRRGFSTTIPVGSLSPGEMEQYERDNALLKVGRREYGVYNVITIINQSQTTVTVYLDFAQGKRIIVPPGTIMSKDNVSFAEFNVVNTGTETVNADEVFITFGYEPPLMRDYRPAAGAKV